MCPQPVQRSFTRGHCIVGSQVMQLLESVYMQSTSDTGDKTTAASAVCKLMQGCAELLRPAANCTVEWRCAALSLMTTAVENFTAQHQGKGSQENAVTQGVLRGTCRSLNSVLRSLCCGPGFDWLRCCRPWAATPAATTAAHLLA